MRAVIGLSTSLGMAVTAERVEMDEQLRRVRAAGCSDVRGFLFGKPGRAGEISEVLASVPRRVRTAA